MKKNIPVTVSSDAVYKRELKLRFTKIGIGAALVLLSLLYLVLYIINKGGQFTISLDPNLSVTNKIVMSADSEFTQTTVLLKAKALEQMDNITESWLPEDIDGEYNGEHSGDNYIAYTFYIKNTGEESTRYERSITVDSVIKNVDEAVRVAIYFNGEKTVYAKRSKLGEPEAGSIAFTSNYLIFKDIRENFEPNSIDKYTVVIWLEGNDPECVDDIIGGEMKMSMLINRIVEETG